MHRPFEIAAYDNTKNFSGRYYFELNPFYGELREARGSALEAHANLLVLDWICCRWFSWDQSWMKSAACCRVLRLEGGTTSEIVVSSANFYMWNPSGRRRSFIIARNSHGPKRVPWGTPAGTSNQSASTPFTFTHCCVPLRKSIIQFTTEGFTPRLRSLVT